MSKSMRPFTLLARPLIRSYPLSRSNSILRQTGQINMQPVKFQKPPVRYGRILGFMARSTLTAGLAIYLLGSTVTIEVKDEEDEEDEAEAEEHQSRPFTLPDKLPEDAIFIPLTLGKEVSRGRYSPDDPEYKAFLAFSTDPQRQQDVRDLIVKGILDTLEKQEGFSEGMGPGERHPTSMHHDFIYPIGPPAEFERLGIEWSRDYIALNSRAQSAEDHARISNVLWPSSIVSAFYNASRTLNLLLIARVKGIAGDDKLPQPLSRAPNLKDAPRATKPGVAEGKRQRQMDARLDRLPDPKGSVLQPDTVAEQNGSTASDVPGLTTGSSAKPSADIPSSSVLEIMTGILPSVPKGEGILHAVAKAFMKALFANWNPRPKGLPRGVLRASGIVNCSSSKATLSAVYQANYNPGTRELDLIDVRAHLLPPTPFFPYRPNGNTKE